ncbi:MAG: hypothetical protein HQL63_15775 [Magnetococcales bacterium]|nr:hypothetical protein [Magnetococcales bacterium]
MHEPHAPERPEKTPHASRTFSRRERNPLSPMPVFETMDHVPIQGTPPGTV